MNPLLLLIGVTVLMSLLEIARPAVRGRRDWALNLQIGVVLMLVQAIAASALLHALKVDPLLKASELPWWLGLPAFLWAMDAAEYAFHRAQHAIPWLWRLHSLHHSDANMSATTTHRHFWGDPVIKAMTVWPLAWAVVAPTPWILAAFGVISLWHVAVHSNVPLSFGRWSWLLNSPAYHRRHHSAEPQHFNSNYAALFPIFDVLFGSYRRPEGMPPTGLDQRPGNIVQAVTWPLRVR